MRGWRAVAEDDDGVLSDEQTDSFLSNSESVPGLSFQLADGIKPVSVAKAIFGSLAFAVALGINTIIDATVTAYTGLIQGVEEFIAGGTEFIPFTFTAGGREIPTDGLIDVTLGAGAAAIEGAWAFSLDEFGLFAYPVAIGVFVVTAYVAQRGLDTAMEVLS